MLVIVTNDFCDMMREKN